MAAVFFNLGDLIRLLWKAPNPNHTAREHLLS